MVELKQETNTSYDLSVLINCGYADRDLSLFIKSLSANIEEAVGLKIEVLILFDGIETKSVVPSDWKKHFFKKQMGHVPGRNYLAAASQSDILLFLDDDLTDLAIPFREIYELHRHQSVKAIRGRIRSDSAETAPLHWDRGGDPVTSLIDTEGLSSWDKTTFLSFGGFEFPVPGVIGHEGINISWSIFRKFGPDSVMYFAKLSAKHPVRIKVQESRQVPNLILTDGTPYSTVKEIIAKAQLRPESFSKTRKQKLTSSVLVTAINPKRFLDNFIDSILIQKRQPDQIVFIIDDTVSNETEIRDKLSSKISKDIELVVATSLSQGRASALNLGLQHADKDYILIWDIDDWYFQNRISSTLESLEYLDSSKLPSIVLFNGLVEGETISIYSDFPKSFMEFLLILVIFEGNSIPFPAAAIKKDKSLKPFREDKVAGIDILFYLDNSKDFLNALFIDLFTFTYKHTSGSISDLKFKEQRDSLFEAKELAHQFLRTSSLEWNTDTLVLLNRVFKRYLKRSIEVEEVIKWQEARIDALDDSLATISSINQERQEVIKWQEARIDALDDSLATISSINQERQEVIKWQEARIDALDDSLATISSINQERQEVIDRVNRTISELMQEQVEIKTERDQIAAERDRITQELDDLTNSTIWRATKPIRKILNLIKR